MDVKEIGVNQMGWFGSGCGLLESLCECGIEPAGAISLGVINY